MKTNALPHSAEALVSRCRELEKKAHVTLDDILNKATQEVAEMLEAHVAGNVAETRKEAGDALLNVLSASSSALGFSGLGFGFASVSSSKQSAAPAALFQKLGAWNSKIQSLRGRYSRSKATAEEVRAATADLVSAVLSFVPEADPVAMLADTVSKFESRVDAYLPKLDLRDYVGAHADFPKPGILFRDVSPMLASPEAMKVAAHEIALRCKDAEAVVGLDARGFLFGLAAAEILGKPFVMVRKKGKLPGETISKAYALEY